VPEELAPPTEADREKYMRLLDGALARKVIDEPGYTDGIQSIMRATTIAEMNAIVQQIHETSLDPIDLARISAGTRSGVRTPNQKARYAAVIAVAVMFVILLILGVVLAAHTHSSSGGSIGSIFVGRIAEIGRA
jgi:hypothetical protein